MSSPGTAVGPPADIFAMASVVVFALTGSGPFGSRRVEVRGG